MTFTLFAAGIIFLLTLVSALFPIVWWDAEQCSNFFKRSSYAQGEYFARGVFLAVGIIDFLVDAHQLFHPFFPKLGYLMASVLCLTTIYVLMLLERWAAKNPAHQSPWLGYLLFASLSLHSIVAGAALGATASNKEMLVLFFAIVTHKAAAAFSLGMNLRTDLAKKNTMVLLLVLFACMTPLGILASSLIHPATHDNTVRISQGIFTAIASGTFVYVSLLQPMHQKGHRPFINHDLKSLLYFGAGIALMTLATYFV